MRSCSPALFTSLLVALMAPAGLAHAESCIVRPPAPAPGLVQQGSACLPTAAAMALHTLGEPTESRDIARRLPFHRDGTDFFDLQNELARRGYESLVFQGDGEAIGAALQARMPVIAAVTVARAKHAVTVIAAAYAEDCSGPLEQLALVDPRTGAGSTQTVEAFERWQFASQLMPIWRTDDTTAEERLLAAGFPLQTAQATNARFRASALLRRALRHEAPNQQMAELQRRATGEDPCWQEAWHALEQTLTTLGDEEGLRAATAARPATDSCDALTQ